MYLFADIDRYSRFILNWEVSDTMTVYFCISNLQKALRALGVQDIQNSDQGFQMTAKEYLGILQQHETIRISMDHVG